MGPDHRRRPWIRAQVVSGVDTEVQGTWKKQQLTSHYWAEIAVTLSVISYFFHTVYVIMQSCRVLNSYDFH